MQTIYRATRIRDSVADQDRLKSISFWLVRRILVVLALAFPFGAFGQASRTVTSQNTKVYFSPGDACTYNIIDVLKTARTSILVQAYAFTSAPIAKALADAHKRGVRVQVILDKSNRTANYSEADFLAHAGIETYIDDAHAIAHNKVIIIDESTVITGSFNFTKAAEERNAENVLIVVDVALAARYAENWKLHCQHSTLYQGK
jgi:phosphatidylserine/phosphatidylglycerophosphate/cardiolipin synthase-like enzyme